MKAILVIDVDDKYLGKEISLIKFADNNGIYCSAELKPMPSRKDNDESTMVGCLQMDIGYILGWNECLEEIENG